MKNTMNDGFGTLKISKDVIATIASSTALEITGVSRLAPASSGLDTLISKNQTGNPVSVTVNDSLAAIDIRLVLLNGYPVHKVSEKVQSSVKEAVQNMVGIAVSKVNVTIQGIDFPEDSEK